MTETIEIIASNLPEDSKRVKVTKTVSQEEMTSLAEINQDIINYDLHIANLQYLKSKLVDRKALIKTELTKVK